MTCLALLLALSGCGENAWTPVEVEPHLLEVAAVRATKTGTTGPSEVSPSGASVEIGGTLQFVALNSAGEPLEGVKWSSSDPSVATVSSTGVAEGRAAGSATVVARSKNRSAEAVLTVASPAPPPEEPAAATPQYPHQPAGFSAFLESSFNCIPGSTGCTSEAGVWALEDARDLRILSDPTAAASAFSIMQTRFYSGMSDGIAPGAWFNGWDGGVNGAGHEYREIYWSFWIKVKGPTYENQSTGTKLGYIASGNGAQQNQHFPILGLRGGNTAAGPFFVWWSMHGQLRPDNTDQRFNGSDLITLDAWHQVEVYMKLNTDDGAGNVAGDGVLRVWVDGALDVDASNVYYRNSAKGYNAGFYNYRWHPVWGGHAGETKTKDDYIELDHIYFSGIRK